MPRTPYAVQRILLIASVVLFAAKLGAWATTHSVTILTDALESIANILAALAGLYAVRLSAKPRDADHPYGHGKVEFFSAGLEGTLVSGAGILIVVEAVAGILRPAAVQHLNVGAVIIGSTGIINFLLGTWAVRTGRGVRSTVVEAAGRHLRTDAWTSAAIVGGIVLIRITHLPRLDGAVALVFAVPVLVTGYRLLRRSVGGLMDEADTALFTDVIGFLQRARLPQWIDLHNVRVIQAGAALHLDGHMTLPYYLSVREAEVELHRLEDTMRNRFGHHAELFVHIDGCMPYQCHLCAVPDCPVRQQALENQLVWTIDNVWQDRKHGRE